MPETLSDDFNRPNSATISDGTHPWVEVNAGDITGAWSIDTNRLRMITSGAVPGLCYWDASVGGINQYAQGTIAGTYNGGFIGLYLRTDGSNGFSVEMADGSLKCIRVVNNSPNTGADDGPSWTPAVGQVWRAEIEGVGTGTTIRLYIDGVLRHTWNTPKNGLGNNAFCDTNVRVGFHLNSENNDTTQCWDDFSAGTLASVPTFLGAGTGALTATSGAACTPGLPTGTVAGDLLIAHVFYGGSTTSPSTPSGWTLLDGPRSLNTPGTNGRTWVYGKIATGSDTAAFGTQAVTTPRRARVYRFTGVRSDTIANVVGGFAFEASSIATYTDVGVTTPEDNALAVNLVAQAEDLPASVAFTGESGGDWTEAIAEFTGTTGTPDTLLQLQTAPMATAGTINGGSQASGTAVQRGITGFYIRGIIEEAEDLEAAVDPAILTLSGQTPTAAGSGDASRAVDSAVLALSGQTPTAATEPSTSATVDPAALALSGQTPAAAGSGTASQAVDTATLVLTGQTPTAAGSGDASQSVDPAALVLTGQTPVAVGSGTASQAVDPAVLTLAGIDVTPQTVAGAVVDPAILVLSGQTPTAAGTGDAPVGVDPAALTLVGATPAAAGSGAASRTVDPATLSLVGQTPVAAGSGTVNIPVAPASLVLTGITPQPAPPADLGEGAEIDFTDPVNTVEWNDTYEGLDWQDDDFSTDFNDPPNTDDDFQDGDFRVDFGDDPDAVVDFQDPANTAEFQDGDFHMEDPP